MQAFPALGYIAGHTNMHVAFLFISGIMFASGLAWLIGVKYLARRHRCGGRSDCATAIVFDLTGKLLLLVAVCVEMNIVGARADERVCRLVCVSRFPL